MNKKRLLLIAGLILTLGAAAFVASRFLNAPPAWPPAQTNTAPAPSGPGLTWMTDENAAREASAKSGKPILLDFTATWCEACHEMDAQVFRNPAVMEKLKAKFVLLRLDVSQETPASTKILDRYGVEALPTVLVVDAKGKPLPVARDLSTLNAAEFLEVLKPF